MSNLTELTKALDRNGFQPCNAMVAFEAGRGFILSIEPDIKPVRDFFEHHIAYTINMGEGDFHLVRASQENPDLIDVRDVENMIDKPTPRKMSPEEISARVRNLPAESAMLTFHMITPYTWMSTLAFNNETSFEIRLMMEGDILEEIEIVVIEVCDGASKAAEDLLAFCTLNLKRIEGEGAYRQKMSLDYICDENVPMSKVTYHLRRAIAVFLDHYPEYSEGFMELATAPRLAPVMIANGDLHAVWPG